MHAVQVARCQFGQFGDKQRGGTVGHINEGRGERQPLRLIAYGLRHFGTPQPDLSTP